MEARPHCALENQQQAADEGSALFSPILRRKVWILDQIGGRTGAYIFVCGATKNIIVELYRTKDEFPILFEEVLIYIESKGFQVKRIHFNSAAEEIGSNVQKLGAHYGFVLDPKPPYVLERARLSRESSRRHHACYASEDDVGAAFSSEFLGTCIEICSCGSQSCWSKGARR
jgi:hypothetical protein